MVTVPIYWDIVNSSRQNIFFAKKFRNLLQYGLDDSYKCLRDAVFAGNIEEMILHLRQLMAQAVMTIAQLDGVEFDWNLFNTVAWECYQLSARKNNDYSYGANPFKNFEQTGLYGIITRIGDKVSRIDSLTNGAEQQVKDESIRETAMDLFNYAVIAFSWTITRGFDTFGRFSILRSQWYRLKHVLKTLIEKRYVYRLLWES